MKTVQLIQGTPEWHAHRAQHFNASDAPAMMGCSPYKTRDALLRELATGIAPDVDQATQRRFDDGHRFEALARPLAEAIVGEDLYPVTGTDGRLSASFDGLALMHDTAFEHKMLNDSLRDAFADMETIAPEHRDSSAGRCLPLHYRVQMEHQLLVSHADRVLFMASNWTDGGELIEERHCWYYPDDKLCADVIAGWEQFAADLATYTPPPAADTAPVGRAPETLPALLVQVSGAVTASNLAEFKAVALGAIRAVNRELRTDQDFADADKAVKWCADVEAKLKAAKEHALSQTATIDALFKALDDISAEARTVRLDLDKLVKRRKDEVKAEAVAGAVAALNQHLADLAPEVAPARLNLPPADFGGAIKGLKTVASMNNALGVALANAKIAADAQARLLRGNLADFKARAAGFEHLFADVATLAHKPADDFTTLVDARITTHKAAEAAKEAQRRALAEQQAAMERQQAELRAQQEALEAHRMKDEQDREDARRRALWLEEQSKQQHQIEMHPVEPGHVLVPILSDKDVSDANARAFVDRILGPEDAPEPLPGNVTVSVTIGDEVPPAIADALRKAMAPGLEAFRPAEFVPVTPAILASPPPADEPATVTLGEICRRFGFTMTAAFVADTLKVPHRATDKAAKLYSEQDVKRIGRALMAHIAKSIG